MANYTQLNTAQNAGDQWTADIKNQMTDNDEYLRNPPQGTYALSTGAANITTASATMVDLTGFTVTVTIQANPGGDVKVSMKLMGRANGTTARFDFLVDGVSVTGDNDALGAPGATGFVTIERIIAVTAGSHTFKVQWRSTSGTVTWYAAGLGQLTVRQI